MPSLSSNNPKAFPSVAFELPVINWHIASTALMDSLIEFLKSGDFLSASNSNALSKCWVNCFEISNASSISEISCSDVI